MSSAEESAKVPNQIEVACPIQGPISFIPCSIEEVKPIADFLSSGSDVAESTSFPRGTLMPDGRLDLCKQSLGPDGCSMVVQSLRNNQFVRSLMLGTDGIGDRGAAEVAKLCAQTESLEIVYLGCNGISAEGSRALAEGLQDNKSVKGLWLKRNPIGPEGCKQIAKLLETNHSIQVLDLVNTGIDFDSLKDLCESIASTTSSITRLYLGGNRLGASHARLLSNLLALQPKLKALLLNVNQLGDEGCVELSKGLARNANLRELGLASNGLGSKGIVSLVDALLENDTVERLDLGFSPSTRVLGAQANHLDAIAANEIARYVGTSKSLQFLDVTRCRLTDKGFDAVQNAVLESMTICELRTEKKLQRSVSDQLAKNRTTIEPLRKPEEVALIKSVYRTK